MNVIIIGLGSDIGRELAGRFIFTGQHVEGTVRNTRIEAAIPQHECDMGNHNQLLSVSERLGEWDLLVFCPGTMEPAKPFFECDTFEWSWAFRVNCLGPLRMLRYLYPKRRADASVCFFGGPNPNTQSPGLSAYAASKIALMRAVADIDAETPDLKLFVLGPGRVDTKIHARKPESFNGSHDDIYECLRWCVGQPKSVIGGRNISVPNDPWRGGLLRQALSAMPQLYKLERNEVS